jgi:hypothetical protein
MGIAWTPPRLQWGPVCECPDWDCELELGVDWAHYEVDMHCPNRESELANPGAALHDDAITVPSEDLSDSQSAAKSAWKCPKCGSTDLDVWVSVRRRLVQDEDGENFQTQDSRNGSDEEWGSDGPMDCNDCGHDGMVKDFETKGEEDGN